MNIANLKFDKFNRVRILNALHRMGITSAEQASTVPDREFLRQPGFGKTSLHELRRAVGVVRETNVARWWATYNAALPNIIAAHGAGVSAHALARAQADLAHGALDAR